LKQSTKAQNVCSRKKNDWNRRSVLSVFLEASIFSAEALKQRTMQKLAVLEFHQNVHALL